MGRVQRLAIVSAVVASLFGYLYQAPNIDGIEQVNKVRILGATMKLMHLVVCNLLFNFHCKNISILKGSVAEVLGLGHQVVVVRKASNLVAHIKDKAEDAGLQVK